MILNFLLSKREDKLSENWLFAISGQSNAVGWSNGAPAEAYLNGPIPNVYIWTGATWEVLEYGVNNEGHSGHGIELNLGYLATNNITGNVYIIKKAQGSTSLGIDWAADSALYNSMVSEFNAAISNLNSNTIPFVFKGFWWDQGESDAGDFALANAYGTNIAALESRINTDIITPPLAFIPVRLDIKQPYTYLSTIRSGQEAYHYVNTDDLTLNGDGVHHTSQAQNTIASRFLTKVL